MAECFCGCGRKVKFGRRGMNRNGAATKSLLAELCEVREAIEQAGPLGEGGDPTDVLRTYDEMIEAGTEYETAWQAVMHGEVPNNPPSQTLAFKREWSTWGDEGRRMNTVARGMIAGWRPPGD